ncbi:hypothetical protein ED312_22785 [Sinomicrobium pectinilyticum]|uniref:Uncharacterized protein n=1 Tax=Sinomicrobium pectinilyticum TaxID=1084421 RepID=A0A3N0D0J6_SINP1|nr:hypothetical protein ED312_22785 [Sinomicrobium pectinilyticum]
MFDPEVDKGDAFIKYQIWSFGIKKYQCTRGWKNTASLQGQDLVKTYISLIQFTLNAAILIL